MFFLFFCIFAESNYIFFIVMGQKKILGVRVTPVSPLVSAWALFLCLFDESKPEGQQNKSCSIQDLVEAISRRTTREDPQLKKLKEGLLLPDDVHDVPFLLYGSLHCLSSLLSTYGHVSITPAPSGGMLVEVGFDSDSSDLFADLYGGR